ncbi:hypothetical protein [Pedobacter sp. NJ-S-72]
MLLQRVVKKTKTAAAAAPEEVNVTPAKAFRARPAGPSKGKAPRAASPRGERGERAERGERSEKPARASKAKPASGSSSFKAPAATNDWNKSNGPSRRSVRPTKGRSGSAPAKTKSPKR